MGVTVDYDGRRFRSVGANPTDTEDAPVGHYHQRGDLVWGEFSGGAVLRGSLAGLREPGGEVEFAYCQVLVDGSVVSGRCVSHPEQLPDGRLRLREQWQRYGEHAGCGVSYVEEVPG